MRSTWVSLTLQIYASHLNSGSNSLLPSEKIASSWLPFHFIFNAAVLFLKHKPDQAMPYSKCFNAFSLLKECTLGRDMQDLPWAGPDNLMRHICHHLHPIIYISCGFSGTLCSRDVGPQILPKTWKMLSSLHAFHTLFSSLLSVMLREGLIPPSKDGCLIDYLFTM